MVGAGLALSLLSGCANKDVPSFFQPLTKGLADIDQTLRASAVPPTTAVESQAPPQQGTARAAPAPAPAEKTSPAAPVPMAESATRPTAPALRATSELVGLDSTMVEQRLGSPALRRRDAPAELWQYRSPLCVMDVFLYSDGRSFKVMHVELHPRSPEQIPAPTCLASFGEERKPAPTAG